MSMVFSRVITVQYRGLLRKTKKLIKNGFIRCDLKDDFLIASAEEEIIKRNRHFNSRRFSLLVGPSQRKTDFLQVKTPHFTKQKDF